jgi:D-alanyl-D-alanine dipeptidase
MELQIYDCPKCLMRLATAKALLKAQTELRKQGLGFKMFDCYRPQSAQYKLWQKVPDRRYVAPPSRGSMHSRGGALDLTLIDLEHQQQLDMGTHYDYFGPKAYWVNKDLPQSVLDNRQLLRSTLEKHGFKTVTTEWWHFNYRRAWFSLSNKQWSCD